MTISRGPSAVLRGALPTRLPAIGGDQPPNVTEHATLARYDTNEDESPCDRRSQLTLELCIRLRLLPTTMAAAGIAPPPSRKPFAARPAERSRPLGSALSSRAAAATYPKKYPMSTTRGLFPEGKASAAPRSPNLKTACGTAFHSYVPIIGALRYENIVPREPSTLSSIGL